MGPDVYSLMMIYYCLYESITIFYGRNEVPRNLVYVSVLYWSSIKG